MKRFIDLTNQITEEIREFAFYDTVTDTFERFSGTVTWKTWEEFKQNYDGDDDLKRYLDLCPYWVLGKEHEKESTR